MTYLSKEERIAAIKAAALVVADQLGLLHVTFATVAEACAVPTTVRNVQSYFTSRQLRHYCVNHPTASDQTKAVGETLGLLEVSNNG